MDERCTWSHPNPLLLQMGLHNHHTMGPTLVGVLYSGVWLILLYEYSMGQTQLRSFQSTTEFYVETTIEILKDENHKLTALLEGHTPQLIHHSPHSLHQPLTSQLYHLLPTCYNYHIQLPLPPHTLHLTFSSFSHRLLVRNCLMSSLRKHFPPQITSIKLSFSIKQLCKTLPFIGTLSSYIPPLQNRIITPVSCASQISLNMTR
jgi:hypothetical protein